MGNEMGSKMGNEMGSKIERKVSVSGRTYPVWVVVPLFIGLYVVLAGVLGGCCRWLELTAGWEMDEECRLAASCVYSACDVLAVLAASLLLFRLEARPWSDLGLSVRGHGRGWLYGFLLAAVLYGIGFGLSLAWGAVEVTGVQWQPGRLAGAWLLFLLVALFEEILVRGFILGRLLHAGMNRFLALFLSASLFGLLHLFNPHVDLLPLVNLILAGMMLGASYLYTRNLCFPISLHLFWNWIQGPVLGYPVSGMSSSATFLQLQLPHPSLLNGGAFGFEGSLLCTVLLALCTLLIVRWGEQSTAVNPE